MRIEELICVAGVPGRIVIEMPSGATRGGFDRTSNAKLQQQSDDAPSADLGDHRCLQRVPSVKLSSRHCLLDKPGLWKSIEWTRLRCHTSIFYVGVDHRCPYVAVPQQLLKRSDVNSLVETVGGKAVPEAMGGGTF